MLKAEIKDLNILIIGDVNNKNMLISKNPYHFSRNISIEGTGASVRVQAMNDGSTPQSENRFCINNHLNISGLAIVYNIGSETSFKGAKARLEAFSTSALKLPLTLIGIHPDEATKPLKLNKEGENLAKQYNLNYKEAQKTDFQTLETIFSDFGKEVFASQALKTAPPSEPEKPARTSRSRIQRAKEKQKPEITHQEIQNENFVSMIGDKASSTKLLSAGHLSTSSVKTLEYGFTKIETSQKDGTPVSTIFSLVGHSDGAKVFKGRTSKPSDFVVLVLDAKNPESLKNYISLLKNLNPLPSIAVIEVIDPTEKKKSTATSSAQEWAKKNAYHHITVDIDQRESCKAAYDFILEKSLEKGTQHSAEAGHISGNPPIAAPLEPAKPAAAASTSVFEPVLLFYKKHLGRPTQKSPDIGPIN